MGSGKFEYRVFCSLSLENNFRDKGNLKHKETQHFTLHFLVSNYSQNSNRRNRRSFMGENASKDGDVKKLNIFDSQF